MDWEGRIHPEIPEDYSVALSLDDDEGFDFGDHNVDWILTHNSLNIQFSWLGGTHNGLGNFYRLVVNGMEVEIGHDPATGNSNMEPWFGWIDGDCIGEVEEYTWEIIGDC